MARWRGILYFDSNRMEVCCARRREDHTDHTYSQETPTASVLEVKFSYYVVHFYLVGLLRRFCYVHNGH